MPSIAEVEAHLTPHFKDFNVRWRELLVQQENGVTIGDAAYRLRSSLINEAAREAELLLYVLPGGVEEVAPEEVAAMWKRLEKQIENNAKIGIDSPPVAIEFEVEFSNSRMKRVFGEMAAAGMPVVL
ncbi:MAG: hypothetical protein IKZ87_00415 [Actinomycetaceae bacterium]|nr:hypothetical protein [Actinomycetaceae bacterium]